VKKIIPLLLVLVLAGCTTTQLAVFNQDVAAIEAKIASIIAAIKAKAPVVLQDAENAISLTCGIVPTAQSSVASFTGSISNPSPKVQNYLTQANNALITAKASCDTWNAQVNTSNPPTFAQAVQVGLAIWNAYQSGKAALQNATTTAAAGA
jgi:hypothetical protein